MLTKNIFWYGHDSFRIQDGDVTIYIDPWKMPANAPKANIILVTHSHYDHYSKPDIELLRKDSTIVIGPKDVATQETGARTLSVNETTTVGAVQVLGVPAYNINKQFHKKSDGWLGFVVTLSDGTCIYHAGDTDFIPEMNSIKTDIALLPVSGTYVMTADEAVQAARAIGPQIVIPMHYGDIVGTPNDAELFRAKYDGQTEIKTVSTQ